jgi:hypothetical protein
MYCKFLGVSKLTEKQDFPVIEDLEDFDPEDLPFVDGSDTVRQVRFIWNKNHKDPHNHAAMMTIVAFTSSHGGEYVSEAAAFLALIMRGDLEARFVTKYKALQKVWRGTTGKKSTKPGGELTQTMKANRAKGVRWCFLNNLTDTADRTNRNSKCASENAMPWNAILHGVPKNMMQHSQHSKCQMMKTLTTTMETWWRTCTLQELPSADLILYVHSRIYSTALTNNHQMKQLFDAIDAVPDPRPSNQYAQRVRSEPKDQAPPATKKLPGRSRRWMIDPEWLRNNPQYNVESRVAESGRLWGDARDPEEVKETAKKASTEKAELQLKKRKKAGNGDGQAGKSRKKTKNKGKGKEKAVDDEEGGNDDDEF